LDKQNIYILSDGGNSITFPKKRFHMTRRGQAALEFLSTYGFAFLIILVMIGALTYFGVLRPSTFIPGSCLIGPEFKCSDRQIASNTGGIGANVSIRVVNQLGNQITLSFPAGLGANSSFGSGPCGTTSPSLAGGATAVIQCNMTGSFPSRGEKVKVGIDFAYTELGGTFTHAVRAEVVESLQ
jgi:hypothetical protein